MIKKFLSTPAEPALFVARLTAAAIILPHGAQKLLGWFGGNGFEATMGFFTQQMGLPAPIALGVIATETLAMLALALGLGGRLMAAALAGTMIGAIATVHGQHGFFMNWFGQQGGDLRFGFGEEFAGHFQSRLRLRWLRFKLLHALAQGGGGAPKLLQLVRYLGRKILGHLWRRTVKARGAAGFGVDLMVAIQPGF